MEHVLEFTSRKLFRTNFCGGWGTKGIAFLYSIYCILILSYVKLLFYGFIDKISNSCGLSYSISTISIETTTVDRIIYKYWLSRCIGQADDCVGSDGMTVWASPS